MTSSIQLSVLRPALLLAAVSPLFVGCDGSSPSTGDVTQVARPTLQSVEFGRLVDVFAFRRRDPSIADRRNTVNRQPTLVAQDVVINSSIESEALFDAVGGERVTANFRFLPFNVDVGHEELLILWDDTDPIESSRFDQALTIATNGLDEIPPSFRAQDTSVRPIPVVPRNAAICLRFDSQLNVSSAFFDANPNALQLLEVIGDPDAQTLGSPFRPATFRVLSQGNSLVIDTTVIGGEAIGRAASTGLTPSPDQFTANFRIALPSSGTNFEVSEDAIPQLNGLDALGNNAVIRDFRSGNPIFDGRVGTLADEEPPTLIGRFDMGTVSYTHLTLPTIYSV